MELKKFEEVAMGLEDEALQNVLQTLPPVTVRTPAGETLELRAVELAQEPDGSKIVLDGDDSGTYRIRFEATGLPVLEPLFPADRYRSH